ncbi:galactosyldiacylglycerol synthase [Micromonospora polyrhachis]|uniref:UDP-N-acetylglucosamine:LPS N-acetylglucosamine transferase n=1 Tax=Micromonospora polyrhachis TaxID=1282883 RepID=A0A7W7SYE9_9ACTN|nr:glycosyltransferase [Micromonospora polyrhachis]MBB4962637.1 UDP-N-acetylglucosamine:LPS N-acetylglucosamine transferase [Micromonospora polyrhachis]
MTFNPNGIDRRVPANSDGAVPAGSVIILSASAGAGHDGAANELADRLRTHGFQVRLYDLADVLPWGLGRVLRGTYRGILTRASWVYGLLFAIGNTFVGSAPATRFLLRPARQRILDRLPADIRLVVSTYPIASQILGPLRRDGRLSVPVVTYLTDFAVNRIWVSPGVDLHCAAHGTTRSEALALGAGNVHVTGRMVADRFRPGSARARVRARQRFGLPAQGRLALLVAGSWGVGEVERTAAEIIRSRAAVPVVVCGRNAPLYRRLRRLGLGYVLGWVDDMADLLRATDVLVENAGGLTALEAMATGVPVATYRPIPGHGRANAVTMARAGVSSWIRRRKELGPILDELIEGERGSRQREAGLRLFESDPTQWINELVRREERALFIPSSSHTLRALRSGMVADVASRMLTGWGVRRGRSPRRYRTRTPARAGKRSG